MNLHKNSNERFYCHKINVYHTLFSNYLAQEEYGLKQNFNPKNTTIEYLPSKREALYRVLDIALEKKKLEYLKVS